MAKRSFICNKCGKKLKNKNGLVQHENKCNGEIKYGLKICEFCNEYKKYKSLNKHKKACHCKKFFNIYQKFLDFLFKLVILYNKKNEKNNIAKYNNEKINIIKNLKLEECKTEEEKKNVEKEIKKKIF